MLRHFKRSLYFYNCLVQCHWSLPLEEINHLGIYSRRLEGSLSAAFCWTLAWFRCILLKFELPRYLIVIRESCNWLWQLVQTFWFLCEFWWAVSNIWRSSIEFCVFGFVRMRCKIRLEHISVLPPQKFSSISFGYWLNYRTFNNWNINFWSEFSMSPEIQKIAPQRVPSWSAFFTSD